VTPDFRLLLASAPIGALEQQVKEQERIIEEKDSRITDLKSGHEKQITEKDNRLNDRTDRINDLKADREKDRENYMGMIQNAQQLIQSLQTQVDQIEAPKQPVSSNFEAVEVDPEPKQEESEQGTGEQEVASAKDHNPKKGLLGRLFS
jgi:chromosome segregation ATPase